LALFAAILAAMTDDPARNWLATPLGLTVLELERRVLQEALADVFGFEMLQIGHWGDAARLGESARTQHRWWVAPDAQGRDAIRANYDALPVATGSIEAVLLPHTLEHAPNPHELLREVDRVLMGEGHVVICGFNPLGPWGLRHLVSRRHFPPPVGRLLSERRIRDWLRLLGFEVVVTQRYLFAPPWARRLPGDGRTWLERRGPELLPPLAGAYLVKARKRVRSLTPIRPVWHRTPAVVVGLAEPTSRNAA
jgi:SAM-dependent methyltransferase